MADPDGPDAKSLEKRTFKCCKTKPVSVVTCINCGELFHNSCADQKKLEYVSKTFVKCCEKQNKDITSNRTENESLKEQIRLLKEIIRDKEVIIKDKEYIITNLEDKIKLITEKYANQEISKYESKREQTKETSSKTYPLEKTPINLTIEKQNEQTLVTSDRNSYASITNKCHHTPKKTEETVVKSTSHGNESQWTQVSHKSARGKDQQRPTNGNRNQTQNDTRSKRIIIRGSAQPEGTTFSAVNKQRIWLSVSKVGETTGEEIKTYLEDKFDGHTFIVESLPKHEQAVSSAYKVGADMDLMDQLYTGSTWPEGVLVQRYNFFRRRPRNIHTS